MRDTMRRGGPDNAGAYFNKQSFMAFGHRRLSIIDLSDEGNQPMQSEDETIIIIFNGEVFNFLDLKHELIKEGFSFKSHSDTEVLVKSYQKWGTNCFSKLRGMFALAIYDKGINKVILARDHAGIKPLYYYCNGSSLYFASEIRAFKKLGKWEENPEWRVFFLTYGYLPTGITTLKGVKPLEKGSFIVFDINTLSSTQSYFLQDDYKEEITDIEEAKSVIRNSLNKAVKSHLIADAPIGLFLSGGIDSSLLTILAKNHKSNLHTLSIVFDDENYSEKIYQDIISKKVGSKHQSFLLDKNLFVNSLPDILEAMDQPSSDGINSYFISKFAKEAGLKAVLSGLGADELFGGYASFQRGELVNRLRSIPSFLYTMAQNLPQDKYKKINFLKNKNLLGDYLFNRGYYTPVETARLLNMNVSEVENMLGATNIPEYVYHLSQGNKTSYLESNLYMSNQLLKDTDIMSMWHSIEVRVPFLDYDFIHTVQKISSKLKFDNK
ncbi:MAG TPA: asparagine synthase (glutamine-hydrolyzing), partial [Chitinophagaceae bacterium]|nr:asparagine synthase (glutamine-hydrolyzing) [Chitinophagaceae bacterium]